MRRISYSAVVLDEKSRDMLIKTFEELIPDDWEIIAHHMTIKMGELNDISQEKQDLEDGKIITLQVIDFAMDDLVMAVGVQGYWSMNKKPHVTIAVNRKDGGKPYLSNKLNEWKSIETPLTLTGKVREV